MSMSERPAFTHDVLIGPLAEWPAPLTVHPSQNAFPCDIDEATVYRPIPCIPTPSRRSIATTRIVRVVAPIAALFLASVAGPALTLGAYATIWGPPDHLMPVCILMAVGHLLVCGAYVGMGESLIEDAIKSSLFIIVGSLWLIPAPMLGLAMISTAVLAFTVGQGLQFLSRR